MTHMEKLNDWVRTFMSAKNAELAAEILELDDPVIAAEATADKLSHSIEQADYIADLIFKGYFP